jgi:site-specific recombinase XerC
VAKLPSQDSLILAFLTKYPNEATKQGYAIALRQFVEWTSSTGIAHVAEVRKPHLDLYAEHLDTSGLAVNTRASKQGVIKRFFAYLVASEMIRVSPVPEKWAPRQVVGTDIDVLSLGDIEALYETARTHGQFLDVGMLIALSGWDGIKVGHLRSLVAEDVRVSSDGTVTIPLRRRDGTTHNRPLSPMSSGHLIQVLKVRPAGQIYYPGLPEHVQTNRGRRHLATVARQAGVAGAMNSRRLESSFRTRALESGLPMDVLLGGQGLIHSAGQSYRRRVALPKHGPDTEGAASRDLAIHESDAAELLLQATHLCHQQGITPIAPIVIAGAALEMVLRRMCEASDVPTASKQPGITAYADALKSRTLISKLAHSQIHSAAKLRNEAAHGLSSAEVNMDQARLMIRSIELFLDDRLEE